MFIEYLVHARQYSRCWGYSTEDKTQPYILAARLDVAGRKDQVGRKQASGLNIQMEKGKADKMGEEFWVG